ncbi:hypothetical protein [Streptomyces sp. NPDC008092]|uniref:hypothetical protein n=1 Tax=Streptomyces sp. NPDC008092 TaxID=3364808 RepID=UPI0036EB1A9A
MVRHGRRSPGDIVLDLDILTAAGTDLRIVTCTAGADSADARKLDTLRACAAPQRC